jgi:hypothetical protein
VSKNLMVEIPQRRRRRRRRRSRRDRIWQIGQ